MVNLDEGFIYYHCFLYITTVSYILCMLFLIHVDLIVEYFSFFEPFKPTWHMNPIVLLINSFILLSVMSLPCEIFQIDGT